jgi:hypothetical protein
VGDLYLAGRTGFGKHAADGSGLLWQKDVLAGVGSMAVDRQDNLLVTSGDQRPGTSPWVSKFAPDGRMLWRLPAAAGSRVATDEDGNVLLVNTSLSKYTPGGTLIWRRPIGGRLSFGYDGTLYLADGAQVFTIAAATGRTIRIRTMVPAAGYSLQTLEVDPAGSIVALGRSATGDPAYWIGKLGPTGASLWGVFWEDRSYNEINALRIGDGSRSVYLFGSYSSDIRGPYARAVRFEVVP